MELPFRKRTRLQNYDYSTPGYYFITICTHNRAKILSDIVPAVCPGGHTLHPMSDHSSDFVGRGIPDAPQIQLSAYGKIVQGQLESMAQFYDDIILEKYVVMPNHIHLLIHIKGHLDPDESSRANERISRFVGTFKRFCNRQIGHNIWQTSFHDHVIRGEADYQQIWMYIETNPARWEKDCFY